MIKNFSLNKIIFGIIFIFLQCYIFSVQAGSALEGEKIISFLDSENNSIVIGQINFENNNGKVTYKIEFEESVFEDEFLSMRPFKCIHKTGQMICHLVYPYEKRNFILAEDLADLEYDLLFLHRKAEEYGISAWNGLYYELTISDQEIHGVLKEVDLNLLASPPENGELRPVTRDMLYDANSANHMFPSLVIK